MKNEFLKELKDLLMKYNVGISFDVSDCSDTHGLSGEKMVVYHKDPSSFKTENWLVVDGWFINEGDISVGG